MVEKQLYIDKRNVLKTWTLHQKAQGQGYIMLLCIHPENQIQLLCFAYVLNSASKNSFG